MRTRKTAIILLGILLFASKAYCEDGQDENVRIKFLSQAYAENRDKFRAFVCAFRVTDATAASVEDALAGKTTITRRRSGLWVVSGNQQLYKLICDNSEDERVPVPGPNDDVTKTLYEVKCISQQILSGGDIGLSWSKLLNGAEIRQTYGEQAPITITPLSYGVMGNNEILGPGLRAGAPFKNGRLFIKADGRETSISGKACEVLVSGIDIFTANSWYLDPEQGFLPVEVVSRDATGSVLSKCFVKQVIKTTNGGFFPWSSLNISLGASKPPFRVLAIEVTDLQLRTPSPAELEMHLPKGVAIIKNEGGFFFGQAPVRRESIGGRYQANLC